MTKSLVFLLPLLLVLTNSGQQAPVNPALADSPWPTYHHDGYAQSASPLRGPEPGDGIEVQTLRTDLVGASPWTLFSPLYPDGSRAVYGATLRGIYKARIAGPSFAMIDVWEPVAWRGFLASASVMYNIILLRDGALVAADPRRRRILRLVDDNPRDSRSPLRLDRVFEFPSDVGRSAHVNVASDGWLIELTDKGWLIAISPDFTEHRRYPLSVGSGDLDGHNAFPIDEDGNIFVVSWRFLTKVRWTGNEFQPVWRAPYDFLGPGCENRRRGGAFRETMRALRGETCTGSGTTPTLIGRGQDDKLVVVADGHAPANNLVAFWRDDPPADWRAIPGQDPRVAGIAQLPHATPLGRGFSVENSPAAIGHDVFVAQWGGIDPECDQPRGVQMVRWIPEERRLRVIWANPDVPLNGVITASSGSNLIYSSGRLGCIYTFFALDRRTGAVRIQKPLGDDPIFVDGGNNISLNDDRSLVFGSGSGLVRLRPTLP